MVQSRKKRENIKRNKRIYHKKEQENLGQKNKIKGTEESSDCADDKIPNKNFPMIDLLWNCRGIRKKGLSLLLGILLGNINLNLLVCKKLW